LDQYDHKITLLEINLVTLIDYLKEWFLNLSNNTCLGFRLNR